MTKLTIREITLCALFVAFITVGTFVRIPLGGNVFTLQFLFTLLAGLVLGPRLGTTAVGAYILLGLLGVPIFATGGGMGYLFRPTFGYLAAFAIQAYLCGVLSRRYKKANFRKLFVINVGGLAVVYIIGVSWFYLVSNYVLDTPSAAWVVLFYSVVLQALPDLLLCAAAAIIAIRCRQAGIWIVK